MSPEADQLASTRYCAVLGRPIAHSASPAMQNAGIAALGLNWRYLAFEVAPERLGPAIAGAQALGFIGLNLTVPHKMLALTMIDEIDPAARQWGAVNTIVFEARDAAGKWTPVGQRPPGPEDPVRAHGYNTDADAIIQTLKEEFKWKELRGAKVLLLGAGGAAKAAALRLAQEGVGGLWLVNRTAARREELKAAVLKEVRGCAVHDGYPDEAMDLVINATSLGLKPEDALPIEMGWLRERKPARVFDMIYRPRQTPFLRAAAEAGCATVNGLTMLLHQGARALELWTGRAAPTAEMRRALEANV